MNEEQKTKLFKDFSEAFPYITLGDDKYGFSKDRDRMGNFWLSKLDQLLNEKVQLLEKEKRTDENQMSHDHAFDEALNFAISIIKGE